MLHARSLGKVKYDECLALMQGIHAESNENYLLFVEHPDCLTLGHSANPANILEDVEALGATVHQVSRGGDVTYHGLGQLVAYPILNVGPGVTASVRYVEALEQTVIDTLETLGISGAAQDPKRPGVWINGAKIASVGVRISRGRTLHGIALNVAPDMAWFSRIVPCGLDLPMTSLAEQGIVVEMAKVLEIWREHLVASVGLRSLAGFEEAEFADATIGARAGASGAGEGAAEAVVQPRGLQRGIARLNAAGVQTDDAVELENPKPSWMRAKVTMNADYLATKAKVGSLHTVCEEAGCPNIFECWQSGTATFMINGSRCTRSCGFCLIDTSKPLPLDSEEPQRVADAVATMGLRHAVVTVVARDDLADGGAGAVAATIQAIRAKTPECGVEVLISDCRGDESSLRLVFDARPDVLNHNVECVARLQRAVRPSAGYARSLAVLARAKSAGLLTKSGMMVGLGEAMDEVIQTLRDLRAVGVDMLTIGQYLRPTSRHLPVAKWWTPEEFSAIEAAAYDLGFVHVVATPLARSSYRAGVPERLQV